MPSRLKDAFHSAMTAAPQDRPKLQELIPLLESYNAWIGRDETLERYPMIRSLLPTAYKPFLKTCCACGHEVDAANIAGVGFDNDISSVITSFTSKYQPMVAGRTVYFFNLPAGSDIAVYTVDGRIVKTLAADGDAVLSLEDVPAGIYIVNVNKTTIKIALK